MNYTSVCDIRRKYIFESKDKGISRSYMFGYEKDNPSYEFLKTKIFCENSEENYIEQETVYTYNLELAKKFFLDRFKWPDCLRNSADKKYCFRIHCRDPDCPW